MSTVWSISANDLLYTVVNDCTSVYSAAITGAVTDEALGNFDAQGLSVEVSRDDLQTRTTAQGLYAIIAYPSRSFPKLTSTSYTVNYTLSAAGFRDHPVSVILPAGAVLPVIGPTISMRRLPVRLQGRVMFDATGVPVVGATVVSVDNPSPPSPPPPPPLPHTILLRSPVYFDHAVNAPVQEATLTSTGTAHLKQLAPSGSTTLSLDTTAGLSGSAFIKLASLSLSTVEYAQVLSLGPQPGEVVLRNPLNRTYAAGTATTVQFVTASPTGPIAKLLLDADAGDGVLVADQLLSATTLVIDTGSPSTVEYHEVGALTDSNGYYALDGIGRVQTLYLRANPVTPGTPVVPWVIEFDQNINVVDFRI